MSNNRNKDLKSRIEKVLNEGRVDLDPSDIEKLLETINVYHVELEYQNEELRRSQTELERTKNHFASLFDNAPVAYVVCDRDMKIIKSNNTFKELLNIAEVYHGQKITDYVAADSQDLFYLFYKRLVRKEIHTSIELELHTGTDTVPVKIDGNVFPEEESNHYRLAITNLEDLKAYETKLEERTWELGERVKELQCMYNISALVERQHLELDELLQSAVDMIPQSWQFPKLTVARIVLDEKEYSTVGFKKTRWQLRSNIRNGKRVAGYIEVCLIEEIPGRRDYPFLEEETLLLGTVANILSRYLSRREAEIRLREREEYYRITLNSIGDAVLSTDMNGCITGLNPVAEKLTGWRSTEVEGRKMDDIFNIVHAHSGIKVENPVSKVLMDGEIVELANHTKLISKDKQEYQIADSAAPILDESGNMKGAVMVFRDVTESYGMREMIKQREKHLRKAQEMGKTGSWVLNLNSGTVQASEESYRIYGLDPSKQLDIKTIQEVAREEYRKMLNKAMNDLIEGKSEYDVEFEICKDDGDIRIIHSIADYNSQDNTVTGFMQDITERRQAERQLKLLSRSVEQNPVEILITNADGNIEYVNPSFTKITGYSFEEVIGKNPRILQSGYQDKSFYKELWNTILSGKDWLGIMHNRKKNGDLYWEEAAISPILENGVITHFVAVKEDVTERKQLMEDLVEAKEKAEESDRLKTAFLANMSHEIRTPMNGILGFTGLLRNPQLSDEKKDKFIDIIHKSGKRLLTTVNDIIEISKIEAGIITIETEAVKVTSRIEEIVAFFMPEANEKGLELKMNLVGIPSDMKIKTDLRKFEAILINLIKNSVKYTQEGFIEVGCLQNKQHLEFYIKDSGIGIPDDRIKAIFNRFEQVENSTTRSFEGSGLGLAIVRSYVDMLDGKVWIESEVGEGSTFYFTLPI